MMGFLSLRIGDGFAVIAIPVFLIMAAAAIYTIVSGVRGLVRSSARPEKKRVDDGKGKLEADAFLAVPHREDRASR
jgi:hypothetical protein